MASATLILAAIIILVIVAAGFFLLNPLQKEPGSDITLRGLPTTGNVIAQSDVGKQIGDATETNPFENTNPFAYRNPFE